MPITKATAFRFTDHDLELLDTIQSHAGLRTRTETLRMVMQHYARTERVQAESAAKKRRGTR